MIRNIIFDWSGTLVDDLPAVWEASNEVFRRAKVPELSLDEFRSEFSLPFKGFYDRYIPHIPLPQLELWFHGHFRQIEDSGRELPHAREFLDFCQKREIRMFVLSTVHPDHFQKQAAATGFDRYFEKVYAGILDKRNKILEILDEQHLPAAETLFVGDMQHDIETAKHGGIHSCAVLTGYNRLDQLRLAEPDVIVEHLAELQGLLERNGGEFLPAASQPVPGPHERPVVTVGALIFDTAGDVLLVRTQKWSNRWGIPGGKVKYGEPVIDALRREIKEETNLDIAEIRFVLVQDCIHSPEFYRAAHFVLLNYTCRCAGPREVVLNGEAQEFRWLKFAESFQLELNVPTLRLLEAVRALPKN